MSTSGPAIAQDQRLRLYEIMTRIRVFETELASLVESKEVCCPCHLYVGQEAVAAGVCHVLNPTDSVWGGHRSHGHYLAKGGDMRLMMAEILGRVTGCSGGRGGSMHLLAKEVGIFGTVPIVAATVPLAVGAALAYKYRHETRVAVAFFGDGTMEEGHVLEAMNLAVVYRLPVIFVCENNLYASHMHLLERRTRDALAGIAASHDMPAYTEDGNDVETVVRVAQEAVDRARSGGGPSFLELKTFRWRGHVGASWDEDVGVKRKDELKDWLPQDPIARMKTAIVSQNPDSEQILRGVDIAVSAEVHEAIAFARNSLYPAAAHVLDHVFVRACS